MKSIILMICISVILVSNLYAQDTLKTAYMDTIVVTATRLDPKFSITRNVSNITLAEIEKLPVQSVSQLLNYALGVSMNSRGFPGVQSDPSLRGAGFEQVLVLLNGMRINDPQTGHHNMNLPVSVNDIASIEVLRGQSSALYGPDAFGGVINVVTKKDNTKKFNINLKSGSFGTVQSSISISAHSGKFRNKFTFENARSDGFRKDTEYLQNNFNFQSSWKMNNQEFDLFAGYLSRDFGANEFYGVNWDSYEEIRSAIGSISWSYDVKSNIKIKSKTYFKQHDDFFNLSVERPAIYTADHKTKRLTSEWTVNYSSQNSGSITFGTEAVLENIVSTTLGDHDVNRMSLFAEYGIVVKNNLFLNTGLRYDSHSVWDNQVNPSFSAAYIINNNITIKASAGQSFRAPSFTELYYNSPANLGSTALLPEKAQAVDFGLEFETNALKGETTFYLRDQSETIDWIKTNSESPWTAVNIFDITSKGIEQRLEANIADIVDLRLNYTYLNQNKKQEGFVSKYALIHPKHQLTLSTAFNISNDLQFIPIVTWKDRPGIDKYMLLDTKLSFSYSGIRFTIEGLNLTDKKYTELRNVPMPGRAIFAGFSLSY